MARKPNSVVRSDALIHDLTTMRGILADKFVHQRSEKDICDKYQISKTSLYRWLDHPDVLKMRVQMGGELAKNRLLLRSEELAQQIIDSIDADCVADMSGLQRVTSYGILVDKCRLMRGEATEIHEHRLDPEYVATRKAEVIMEMQRRGLVKIPQDVVPTTVL